MILIGIGTNQCPDGYLFITFYRPRGASEFRQRAGMSGAGIRGFPERSKWAKALPWDIILPA